MKRLYLLCCYLLFANIILAQDYSNLSFMEMDSLTMVFYQKGDYKNCALLAEDAMEKAKVEFGEQDSIFATYTGNSGFFYYKLGDYKKAEDYYQQANYLKKKLFGVESKKYATNLNNLAALYKDIGYFDKAEQLYLKANEIDLKLLGEEHPYYATSLNNLAVLYQAMGSYEKAVSLFLQVKAIRAKHAEKNPTSYATSLSNLGNLYHDLGRYEEAERLLLQAKDIDAKVLGEHHVYYTISLNNLANLYQDMGKFKQAIPLYLQAKAIRKKVLGVSHPAYAKSVYNLGYLYLDMGKLDQAMKLAKKALNLRKKIYGTKHASYALSLSFVAKIYFHLGQLDTAYKYGIQGISANCMSKTITPKNLPNLDKYDYFDYSRLMNSLSVLLPTIKAQYQQTSTPNKLQEHFLLAKAAMRISEKNRNKLNSEDDKLRLLRSNTNFVAEGIATALALEEDYHKEAFTFAELNKSILLADAIKGNRARNLGDLPDSLINKEAQLQNKLQKLKKKQIQAKGENELKIINRQLSTLQLEIDAFIKAIQAQYPKYHALKYENITAKLSDIQNLLDEKSCLLEYFITDSLIYLFEVSKQRLRIHTINISKKLLYQKVDNFRRALSDYTYIVNKSAEAKILYTETAYWFYKNIIEVALQDESIQKLIIITDGQLGHIPFDVFLTDNAQQKSSFTEMEYLLKQYDISYDYSATLWEKNSSRPLLTNNHKTLAFAATYPTVDSSLLSVRLPQEFEIRSMLKPIEATQQEVKQLSKSFQGTFAYGEKATERYFKETATKYGVIHLAMHGVLDKQFPMLSSLAFTENRDSTENNFLHAYEIARMDLNANLVVLSACETGYGKFEQGEGIISLARSFMYAGTPSLVVSLWEVNDQSTASIMKAFYKYLIQGQSKDAALKQAKIDYLEKAEGIAAHPAFWSPFIQIGDARAIQLKKKSSFLPYGIGFAVLIVLGGLLFLLRVRRSS